MRSSAVLLLSTALATPVAADTVHLVNGNRFEEVEAERSGGEVRIRLPYGEIVLPERVVARVESSPAAWLEYAARERRLASAGAAAADWLELALWADERDYAEGMRRALLRAAELQPGLAGLAPLMTRIGYLRDSASGQWLAEADYMRRRGYRLWSGSWISAEEFAARQEAQRQSRERRRQEAREERLTRAFEALVLAQLARQSSSQPEARSAAGGIPLVTVYSGGFLPLPGLVGGAKTAVAAPAAADYEQLARRQPGSLFPVAPPRRHLRSSE